MKAFISCVALFTLSAVAFAADWPVFRGPDRNGISRESDLAARLIAAPAAIWSIEVGDGLSAVSVARGRAYTMGHRSGKDTVWCLDAATGKVIWQYSYDATARSARPDYDGPRATPTVDGDTVFTLSRDGQLFALDANGQPRWSVDVKRFGYAIPNWGFSGSPLVLGDRVIVNAGSAGLAVDRNSGNPIWHSPPGLAGYNTPTVYQHDGKPRLAFSNGEQIVSVDPADGRLVWQYPWPTPFRVNSADLIVTNGRLFVSSGYGYGSALLDISSDKPSPVYQNKLMRNHFHTCMLIDGYLYGIDGDQQRPEGLKCMELASGQVRWHAPQVRYGGLIAAEGRLIIVTETGELVIAAASPEKYEELARFKVLDGVCWTAPSLSDGRLYVRSRTGRVVCLELARAGQAAVR